MKLHAEVLIVMAFRVKKMSNFLQLAVAGLHISRGNTTIQLLNLQGNQAGSIDQEAAEGPCGGTAPVIPALRESGCSRIINSSSAWTTY